MNFQMPYLVLHETFSSSSFTQKRGASIEKSGGISDPENYFFDIDPAILLVIFGRVRALLAQKIPRDFFESWS